jgi:hypothetical protein
MKKNSMRFAKLAAAAAILAMSGSSRADTLISNFDNFNLDVLFAWANATIVSGPTNYQVTFSGFGSGYKMLNPAIDATGERTVELTVNISADGARPNDPVSGPIVALVDGDGTMASYAWYGQTIGTHVLTASVSSGTGLNSGSIPGLDLSTLSFFHLEDDPGAYRGTYTITFEKLRLTGAPRPLITAEAYNPDTQEFTLTWKSLPGKNYTILLAPNLSTAFSPVATDVPSGGASTTNVVVLPGGNTSFLQVVQQ